MTFQEVIQHIESNIGTTLSSTHWTAQLLAITERTAKAIKVNVKFSTTGFSFNKEIKLFEAHYDSAAKFTQEINRQLNRLDNFTDAIANLSVIAPLPTITNE